MKGFDFLETRSTSQGFYKPHHVYIVLLLISLTTLVFFTPWASAQEPHPFKQSPSTSTTPVLTMASTDYRATISMADIESLNMFETDEFTHYDGPKGKLAGVWLNDLLRKYQMDDEPRLRFRALDGYEAFITKERRQKKRFLLATRLNGNPISSENLGPLMLIIPSDIGLPPSIAESKSLWIWAINDITAQ